MESIFEEYTEEKGILAAEDIKSKIKDYVEDYLQKALEMLNTPEKKAEFKGKITLKSKDGKYILWFMRQNPYKTSKWARLSRQGHEIIQIICKREDGKDTFYYVGIVVDKELIYY